MTSTTLSTDTAEAPAIALDPVADARERRARLLMLVTLSLAMFFVSANSGAISPFLLAMADDLGTSLAAIANLAAYASLTWAAGSLCAGTASDLLGRRPLILFGLAVIGASSIGVAVAQSYGMLVFWRMVSGIGGGAYMGSVFAAVADRFPAEERGRSLGWLATGQSLSLVIGVPILTMVGSVGGWRGASWAYGLAVIVATIGAWAIVPASKAQSRGTASPFSGLRRALTPRTGLLIASGVAERLCFAGISLFFPTYLLTTYDIELSALALALVPIAAGNFVGNIFGGRLADRFAARDLAYSLALAATGLLALPVLMWTPGLLVSVGLGFAYNLLNAIGRPVLLTALSGISQEARGALLGLNITAGSMGWLLASAIGGPLIINVGFGGLGQFTAAVSALGATLALTSWLLGRRRERVTSNE
ncbi:MAG: MFS transporter [Thermomicrobiales bacterium]